MNKEGNSQFSCPKYTTGVWWNTIAYWEKKQRQKYNDGGKRAKRIGWKNTQNILTGAIADAEGEINFSFLWRGYKGTQ